MEQGRGCWNPTFIRPFNDWEMEHEERLLFRLREKKMSEGMEDFVQWRGTKHGVFLVKAMYKTLEQKSSPSLPWKSIWRSGVQPKLCFFTWEATWRKILTLDQVQKRGLALATGCFLCQESEETVNYILLHCTKTRV